MMARFTRRDFLKTSAAAGVLSAAGAAPAWAQGTRLHFLQWSHFIPAADQVFEAQAKEFGRQAGVEIAIERINQNDIQARLTAAIQSASGPDIVIVANNHALLYESSLVDVTDVAEEIGRKQGGWHDYAKANGVTSGGRRGAGARFHNLWAGTHR